MLALWTASSKSWNQYNMNPTSLITAKIYWIEDKIVLLSKEKGFSRTITIWLKRSNMFILDKEKGDCA